MQANTSMIQYEQYDTIWTSVLPIADCRLSIITSFNSSPWVKKLLTDLAACSCSVEKEAPLDDGDDDETS